MMGEKLLPYAKRLITDYDTLIDAIHLEAPTRYLRIAYTGPLEQRLLQQTIPLFHHHYPNVDIQLANYSMVQLTKVVEANECDIALVVPKEVDDPHYYHRMIMQRPICVAVSKSSPLASFTEVAMDQLFDQKFVVLWPQASTHASQQIRTWLLDMGWPKSNIIYADNIESQLLMVSLNEGITLMPKGKYDDSIQLIPLVQPSNLIHTTEAVWKEDDPIVLTMIDLLTRQSNINT